MPFPTSAAIGAGSGLVGSALGYFGSKKERKAREKAYNRYATARQKGVEELLGALKEHGYDPFSPFTSTTGGTSETAESYSDVTTPEITGEYKPLAGLQRQLVEKRLASPTGLPPGYEETGISAINQATEGALQNVRNLARERGLPASTLLIGSPAERARAQQIGQFRAQAPLLARQLQTEDVGLAQNILAAFGRAERRKGQRRGTTTSTGTSVTPPNLGDLANLLMPPAPPG